MMGPLRKISVVVGSGAILLFSGLILTAATIIFSPGGFKRYHAWMMEEKHLGNDGVVLQDKRNNCGPAALKMIFDHYGIASTLTEIEDNIDLTEKGSSMLALKEMAQLKGLKAEGWRYTLKDFLIARLPAIVFIHNDHFAVVDSITPSHEVLMRDPSIGRLQLPVENLPRIWNGETLVFRNR